MMEHHWEKEKYLIDMYMLEYGKHRDEIQNRIKLQNDLSQRGVTITVLAASLLATLFTFFMKDFGSDPQQENFKQYIDLFLMICIPILFLHNILIQLTLASWIYQINIMFKLVRYWNWIVIEKIEPLLENSTDVFLWDRSCKTPWENVEEGRIVNYFQPAFLYALCFLSIFCLVIVFYYISAQGEISMRYWSCLGAVFFLSMCCLFLLYFHFKEVKNMEKSIIKLKCKKNTKKSKIKKNGENS